MLLMQLQYVIQLMLHIILSIQTWQLAMKSTPPPPRVTNNVCSCNLCVHVLIG